MTDTFNAWQQIGAAELRCAAERLNVRADELDASLTDPLADARAEISKLKAANELLSADLQRSEDVRAEMRRQLDARDRRIERYAAKYGRFP